MSESYAGALARTDTAARLIAAPPDRVYAALVDPDVPGVRVTQAVDFVSDDPAYTGTMTMTWALTAVDAGTRVDIRAGDVPAGIDAEDHAAGLASSLANRPSIVAVETRGAASVGRS